MQRIDRRAITQIGIPRLLLMDHAGLAIAAYIRRRYSLSRYRNVLLCCGSGYNGGDGLSAARHLLRWGYQPRIAVVGSPARLREEPKVFAAILRRLRVPMLAVTTPAHLPRLRRLLRQSTLVVDALLGIGLRGALRPLQEQVIAQINRAGTPIVSADVPSGLDGDSGLPHGAAVRASATVTFGAAKRGLLDRRARPYVGRLLVDDASFPPQVLPS
ncbi:MAG: NAD(P)H-hydrate epimerase [Candidatus Omnitrophica bacterium]|nr:NAD(P)H-hydrate epimerase [Candidatus Omnitrophota bacterium]